MKNTKLILFTWFLTLFAVSCSSDSEEGVENVDPSAKIEILDDLDDSPMMVGPEGGQQTINFNSPAKWHVKVIADVAADEWLTVTPQAGNSGIAHLALKLLSNEEKSARSGNVIIITPFDTASIELLQLQKDALVKAKEKYYFNESGGTLELHSLNNAEFDVSSDVSWIRQQSKSAEKVVLLIGPNTDNGRRIGTVTFTSKDKQSVQTVEVIQDSKNSKKLSDRYVPVNWNENRIVRCDPQNGIFSFIPSSANEPKLETGSVFVVDVDTMAYVAVVKNKRKAGNTVTVETVQGNMCDIFKNIDFTLTTQQLPAHRSSSDNVFLPEKVFYRGDDGALHPQRMTRSNSSFTGELWKWDHDMNGHDIFAGKNYRVYLEQSEYNLSLDLKMDFNFGGTDAAGIVMDGVKRYQSRALEVKASVMGTASTVQKLRADIWGGVSDDYSHGELIKRNIFTPQVVIFNVYGVPVSIVLHSDLYVGGWVKAAGSVSAWMGFKDTFQGEVGLGWKQRSNEISPIIRHNNTVSLIPPTIEGKGTVDIKACIFPRVCTSLYGVLGPTFDIKPFVRDSLNGGFHEELLSSSNDYCAWNMNLFAGVDLDAGFRLDFLNGRIDDHLLSRSNLPEAWKKWLYWEKHLYETPVDMELESGNSDDIKVGKPMDVSFKVFDNFYLKHDPKVPTILPQIVKFEAKGDLKSKYDIAKDGIVTARWTPASEGDQLRAILYDENMDVIKEVKFPEEAPLCPDDHHPHFIDLGLPSGTKWACCNVGTNIPEGYGSYFAWGETSPKACYDGETYKFSIWRTDEDGDCYFDGYQRLPDFSGNPQYDAAAANWGGGARMPTYAECDELVRHCTSVWTTINGVNGRLVTGPNGNSIFLPAAGYRYGTSLYYAGEYGDYWSSAPCGDFDDNAYYLFFYSGDFDWNWYDRLLGRSVRPVRN